MKPLLKQHRKAIAMIELIFAIVIMGIVMLSAPMMLTTATKSSEVAFQQESIAVIASHANSLLTYAWDEGNTDSAFASTLSILSTGSTTAQLDRNDTRSVIPAARRYKSSILTLASATLGGETGETRKDDIDDFNGFSNSLHITNYGSGSTSDEDEYMDINLSIQTNVRYIADAASSVDFSTCTSGSGCAFSNPFTATAPTTTTNIKTIQTTLTSSNVADKSIVLKSFICNIGSAGPRTKVF